MASGAARGCSPKELQTLYSVGAVGNLTDAQLLERFLAGNEGAAEAVFTALVQRHGPMVLRVCRNVLHDEHEAQDAFQATFLILVRRAGSVRNRASVAHWLFGVAHRVARRASTDAARRRTHERRVALSPTKVAETDEPGECWPELHDEIARLPERQRAAVVLCYLEGLTTEAAAFRLDCPRGTILSRLARARDRLRQRLARRGLGPQAGVLATGHIRGFATAIVPEGLSDRVVQAAARLITGNTTPWVVSVAVDSQVAGELNTMVLSKLKSTLVVLAALGLASTGVGLLAEQAPASRPEPTPSAPKVKSAARPPVAQYEALIREFHDFKKRAEDDRKSPEIPEQQRAEMFRRDWPLENRFTARFLDLARTHPADPAAFDALAWVVVFGFSSEESDVAAGILARDHGRDPRLWPTCQEMSRFPISLARGALLRAVREQSPDRVIRGRAGLALAGFLKDEVSFIRLLRSGLRPYQARFLTESRLEAIRAQDPDILVQEMESVLKQVARECADIRTVELTPAPDLKDDARNIVKQPQDKVDAEHTLGERARPLLEELHRLDIGRLAPEIEGKDADGNAFKLSDYRGKVVVLTFSGNWSRPCRMMYRHERELVKRYAGQPFALLSVNTDKKIKTLRASIDSGEITWRCWWEPEGMDGAFPKRWNIQSWPTVYILDQHGVIRLKFVGIMSIIGTEKSGPNLERAIDPLLGEVKPDKAASR